MCHIAGCYFYGEEGLPHDEKKAVGYFSKAAKRGHPVAACCLASARVRAAAAAGGSTFSSRSPRGAPAPRVAAAVVRRCSCRAARCGVYTTRCDPARLTL